MDISQLVGEVTKSEVESLVEKKLNGTFKEIQGGGNVRMPRKGRKVVPEDQPELKQRVVHTDEDARNGQLKCPKCGATDIVVNPKTGKLVCTFCRHEFDPQTSEDFEKDIFKLNEEVIGSGALNIDTESPSQVTIKCSSCGAEVVVDTSESTQARCPWCRNTLSVNEQVPNGAVPDMVLPFAVTKAEAKSLIDQFVGGRKFFAHPQFTADFSSENVMGIYLPYLVVDVNAHAEYRGNGEHLVRKYTVKRKVGNSERTETRYDADYYSISRGFDIAISGLTIESSSDKADMTATNRTNNIINSIMPFDTENCVKWNPNYLKGFASEKRDVDLDALREKTGTEVDDIARYVSGKTTTFFDRGVQWSTEEITVKGRQWKTAYLPVWLYSYKMDNGNGNDTLHYVAVNARTKETMGSVPINEPKLIGYSVLVEIISILFSFVLNKALYVMNWDDNLSYLVWLLWLGGIAFYAYFKRLYRNQNARHNYESETHTDMAELQKQDTLVEHRKGLSNATME
jgi:ribosomal protein S27E